jgi:hypothetical protein
MADLRHISDDDLVAEVLRRGGLGDCPTCRKWQTYMGAYDRDGWTLRCHGCVRAIARCSCR